jgi:hemoglobin
MNSSLTLPPKPSGRDGRSRLVLLLVFGGLLSAVAASNTGCGTGDSPRPEDKFFTSGSREADQRASQRMAKEEQLAGPGAGKATGREGAAEKAEGKKTLYERLGGNEGLTAIVHDFTERVLQDPRVNWDRAGVKRGGLFAGGRDTAGWEPTPESVGRLRTHLVQFFALATGGPPRYDGKEMKSAHAGMRIDNSQFDAAVGDLKAALDRLQVPDAEQKELLAIVESTRPQIVSER